ncbi:MAG: hypothetical protein ACKO9T_07940, partial [Nitrospira sp.]
MELTRAHVLSGLPWMLLGYSQHQWLPIIQISDITSVYGVSWVIVLVNVVLTDLLRWSWSRFYRRHRPTLPWHAPALAILTLTASLGYGEAALRNIPPPDSKQSVA